MDTNQILHALSAAEGFPLEAIEAAREQRGVVAPAFVREVERFVAGDHAAAEALFFVFHLLGEWREKSAYRPLAAFLRLPGADVEKVLGDAITATSHRVIAGVFDGDPTPLYAIIREPDADEFARSRMCEALAMVTLRGELPREQTSAFLRACFGEFTAKGGCYVWKGWQGAIAMLGLVELVPLVRQAFERGLIPDDALSLKDFEEDFDRAVAGESSPAVQGRREFELFGDAVEELSTWAAFSSEEDDASDEKGDDTENVWLSREPVLNPYRNVGRNDPCPCGSGKKFKKCCLVKVEAEQRERSAAARFHAQSDLDPPFADDDILDDALDRPILAYDADVGPDPERWLALDEDERLRLVKDYHRRIRDEFARPDAHAAAHVTVENQIAMGDELPVRRKLAALMEEGLDRHDALHAIGAVLLAHLNEVMRGAARGPAPQANDAYFAELEGLTAASWRRDFG